MPSAQSFVTRLGLTNSCVSVVRAMMPVMEMLTSVFNSGAGT